MSTDSKTETRSVFFNRHRFSTAQRLLKNAQKPLILTGAGISIASGVPPFRGKGGLWASAEMRRFSQGEIFKTDPESAWNLFEQARCNVSACLPNRSHAAISEYLAQKPQGRLVTQNVDGLHGENALEFHGSLHRYRCQASCGFTCRASDIRAPTPWALARCPVCGADLRHDVILFGETLTHYEMGLEWLSAADLVLFVGTSGTVTPTTQIARWMSGRGVPTIEVNPAMLTLSRFAVTYYLPHPAEEILPELLNKASI